MKEKAIVVFRRLINGKTVDVDLEVPLEITANELVEAVNEAYQLGIDVNDVKHCYLRCERPIVLLRGEKTLKDFGVRDATLIHAINQGGR